MDRDRISGKIQETEGKIQKTKGRITGSTTDKVVGSAKAAEGAPHMPSQPQPAPFMPQSAAPYRPGQQAQGLTPYYRASQMVAVGPPITDRKNGIALIVLACLGFLVSIVLLVVSRTSEGY